MATTPDLPTEPRSECHCYNSIQYNMKELNSLRNRPVKHRQWPCVYQYFMLLRMSISSAMFMWHPGTSSALATNSALLYACRLKLGGLVLCYNKTLHRTNMGKRSLARKIPRFRFHNAKTYGKSNLITYYATYGCCVQTFHRGRIGKPLENTGRL